MVSYLLNCTCVLLSHNIAWYIQCFTDFSNLDAFAEGVAGAPGENTELSISDKLVVWEPGDSFFNFLLCMN